MPGPVSDSYDPEFGTGENVSLVHDEVKRMYDKLGEIIGSGPKYIIDIVRSGPESDMRQYGMSAQMSEADWRILRFACERALESL
jgi:hypothetical protein